VVLLSPMELDTTMRMILQVPIWAQRVIYIQGSCLKDGDLARARMNEAEACFVLAARNYADKTAAVSIADKYVWLCRELTTTVTKQNVDWLHSKMYSNFSLQYRQCTFNITARRICVKLLLRKSNKRYIL
jgi:hypothetical protein